MPTRPDPRRNGAQDRAGTRPGGVFGREWWGFDRDGLEAELARQEADQAADQAADHAADRKAGKTPPRAGGPRPH